MLEKRKPIRLKGKQLAQLNDFIWWRDNCSCVLCKKWVEEGTKFHHVIFKSHGGSDTKGNGVTLCMDCHRLAHGEQAESIRQTLLRYLEQFNCISDGQACK